MISDLKFGITKPFPCSYLDGKEEKLLVAVDDRLETSYGYEFLMAQGFRRSGDQIYRPYCEKCNACQSVRVLCGEFKASKSQKRLLRKNNEFKTVVSDIAKDEYYQLFEAYINTLHQDGTMFPATPEQYKSFLTSNGTRQIFLEVWHDELLISVAITDVLLNGLSAVYTFYHPAYRNRSIGMYSILKQIQQTLEYGKQFLYLGYQIDDCQKMNYKDKFHPHQRLIDNSWQTVNK